MSSSQDNVALYAAIKTFYGEGHDKLSAVCSLVLAILHEHDNITDIRLRFSQEYQLDIPTEALKTILKRLRRDDFIAYETFSAVRITANGKAEAEKLQQSTGALRREFQSLVANLETYFKGKKYTPLENTEKALLGFIDENLGFTSAVVVSRNQKEHRATNSHIAEFILNIENTRPDLFDFLQNIFFGRLYLSLINTRADYSKNPHLDKLNLYLDTNILFSLLGLHGEESRQNSTELINILKRSTSISVYALSTTIQEARRVLGAHTDEAASYFEHIPVNSVYHSLGLKGIGKYTLSLITENLDEKIEGLGIEIVDVVQIDTHENKIYGDFASEVNTWSNLLDHPKREQALQHDAIALTHIHLERRTVRTTLFEKCRSLFVTPDRAVFEVAREQAIRNHTFPLSLRPVELVSLLWLRDIGNSTIATNIMRQSVMAYAREKAISHKLWNVFTQALHEAEKNNELTRDDIGLILSSDDTEMVLAKEQFEAPKIIAKKSYVNSLRKNKQDLEVSASKGKALLTGLEERIHSWSHIAGVAGSTILWTVLVVPLAILLYILITALGVEKFSSVVAILLLISPIIAILITGKNMRVTRMVISMRSGIYRKIYQFVNKRFRVLLIRIESDEAPI